MTALVTVLARTPYTIPPALPPGGVMPSGPFLLLGWYKMDSVWYDLIASRGYAFVPGGQSSVAFFPSYPLAVRGLAGLLGNNTLLAGSLIALGCAAGAVTLFLYWVWSRMPPRAAMTSLAVLMLYPYAYYLYGAMYSDSMFLLTALGSFMLLEQRRFWLAGLVGMLDTAGRPFGIAVAVGLAIRMLEIVALDRPVGADPGVGRTEHAARGVRDTGGAQLPLRELVRTVPRVRWREAGVLIAVGGLLAWCGYVWMEFGHPLVWMQEQAGWDQAGGPATWFKLAYLDTLRHGTRPFASCSPSRR